MLATVLAILASVLTTLAVLARLTSKRWYVR